METMEKLTKKEQEKIWALLDSPVTAVTLHFESGAKMEMSKKAFDSLRV